MKVCGKCGLAQPDEYCYCWHCWYSHGGAIPLSKSDFEEEPTDNCKLCGREHVKLIKEQLVEEEW